VKKFIEKISKALFENYKLALKAWILAHAKNVTETLVSIYLTFLWHFQHGPKFKPLGYVCQTFCIKWVTTIIAITRQIIIGC
jgi:hypothetical protein